MKYLTYPQASAQLAAMGVPLAEATLRRMVAQKRIPFTKLAKRVLFDPDRLNVAAGAGRGTERFKMNAAVGNAVAWWRRRSEGSALEKPRSNS